MPADRARHALLTLRRRRPRQRLRPFERRIVDLLAGALLEEGLPSDALGHLEPGEVRLAKTASKHVRGVMNQIAFEIGWATDRAGGLWNVDVADLNRHLRRSLHTNDGDYRIPLELVRERLGCPR